MHDILHYEGVTMEKNLFETDIEDKFMEIQPEFSSASEAIASFSKELEVIAAKRNLTVDELLMNAEISELIDEELLSALSLSRRILRLKR
jgi:hypothetical protein